MVGQFHLAEYKWTTPRLHDNVSLAIKIPSEVQKNHMQGGLYQWTKLYTIFEVTLKSTLPSPALLQNYTYSEGHQDIFSRVKWIPY